jgi:putative transport protein
MLLLKYFANTPEMAIFLKLVLGFFLRIGLALALLPYLLGLLIGYCVIMINPVILLGAQSGAGTNTTSLKALHDKAGRKLPVLGYTIPYALGIILLTAWGPVIVALMS